MLNRWSCTKDDGGSKNGTEATADERASSRQLLGQGFVLCGAKQKEAEASSYKVGSEPGGTGPRAAGADIQDARRRGLQILSQGLPLTRVMERTASQWQGCDIGMNNTTQLDRPGARLGLWKGASPAIPNCSFFISVLKACFSTCR